MSFGDHLDELRRRLLLAIAGILPIFFVAMGVGRPLLGLLMDPIRASLRAANQPSALLATGPFEAFGTYFRVVLVVTILAGAPWIVYHLWKFVSPGLYAAERRFAYLLVPMSALLTFVGVAFFYFVILPVVLAFLVNFGSTLGKMDIAVGPLPEGVTLTSVAVLDHDPVDPVVGQEWINTALRQVRFCIGTENERPVIVGAELSSTAGVLQQYRISEYVKMLLNFALAFGVAFQMPIVVLLLGWAGIIDRQTLARYRRHVCAVCAVLGALLTPADPLSMLLMAIPLYLLFELGMILLVVLPADRVAGTRKEGNVAD
ncbi:MAG: preprotein translocase subunit TatC [Leptolyngbya sp. PLA3]|nr:MAG: preprotein translocase subunit TatC [Cyanobacteria bacterium CYA]MCE7968915.1 preprotein translocase subunit TatC [Leptolyngbya sp. PL-A3]